MGEVVVGGGGVEADVVVRGEEAENGRERDDKGGSSEVVRWEKFLPRMVLRVLLVEADDSTRQIISALLRKCSYKVSAVPDGLMAWETIKGRPHNIDLILTEVELPSISGYALLTLVMEHDICKNIPVIMMSSHDSISMVLKCMLKGAADFLIKPVRRNELRNLWQHVWRRQTLTAGHIPQDSPYTQHKVEAGCENNSASDHSSECATSSRKRKECSDEGSDLQVLSPMECKIVEKEKYKVCVLSDDEKSIVPDEKAIDHSTRIGSVGASLNGDCNSRDLELDEEFACGRILSQDEDLKPEKKRENVDVSHNRSGELIESSGGAIDLIGTFDDAPKHAYRHLKKYDAANKFEVTPELELSLTRFFHDDSNQGVEGRDALNHSSASAFSWYNNKTLQPLFPTSTNKCTEFKENVRETLDPSADAVDKKNSSNLNVNRETVTNLAIGQSAEAELAYQNTQKLISASEARLDNGCYSRPTGCHPNTVQQEVRSPKIASQQEHSVYPEIKVPLDGTAMNSMSQNMHQPNNTEVADQVSHGSPASGYSRSSSMSHSAADHTNSSAHGSFTSRSDGNVGFAVTPDQANVPESLNDGSRLFAHDGFRGMDALRSSQREAALTKFRLKRKDRCYEKKVRYQSRKRLAEQRPRVKGQFVRQVPNDAPIADANC